MSHSSEERHSADLLPVAEQLREGRHEPSALDLDQIKMRAIAQATHGSASLAPKRGRHIMKKRSLLATLLVLGAIASGGATTMAVTGQFSPERAQAPSASASQYVNCKTLVRNNRAEEKSTRRADKRAAKLVDDRGDRKRLRRSNLRDRKRQRRGNRREEKRCRAGLDR